MKQGDVLPVKEGLKNSSPGYAEDSPPDITAAFSSLNLSGAPQLPSADQCIAHLKLLEAFSQLREDIGCRDGLYGLFDHLVSESLDEATRSQLLARMREKRWAIFVNVAAARFETWWLNMTSTNMMIGSRYAPSSEGDRLQKTAPMQFSVDDLPPLGETVDYEDVRLIDVTL